MGPGLGPAHALPNRPEAPYWGMHRWAPSRSLEILYQRLLTAFGWGMTGASVLQLGFRLAAPPSPSRMALVVSSAAAVPIWVGLTLTYRAQVPSKALSDRFAMLALGFVALQLLVVTWFVRDPMRIAAFFTLLAVVGVFVRRVRHYVLSVTFTLLAIAGTWSLAPPPGPTALWLATQLGITLAVGVLIHLLIRRLLHRVGGLLARLVEARRTVAELRSLIPICASCKSIRNDEGTWERVEVYVERHTRTPLTHGLCPTCLAQAREELRRS